jgi:NDP-sugar pyrophosphorylase family protein
MKSNNTVCILASGKGTRMGPLGLKLAKALHPIGGKAIISRIIEKFPIETEFLVSLGFHGEQVKQYLSLAHEDRKMLQ